MKFALSVIIIFLLVLFQISLYPYLEICSAFPNLILILVLIFSILKGFKKSLLWIIFGGFLLDVYSFDNPIGSSVLGLLLVSYLVYFFSQNVFKKTDIFSVVLFGIGATLIYGLFVILFLLIIGTDFQLSFSQVIMQIIYNLIVFIPLFYFIKRLTK